MIAAKIPNVYLVIPEKHLTQITKLKLLSRVRSTLSVLSLESLFGKAFVEGLQFSQSIRSV